MLGAAGTSQAQDDPATVLDRITISPNRIPTEADKVGSKVEQVTQEEIEEKSYPTLVDYLTRLPGVSFTANGGLGTSTNLHIRGLPGGYVKTLYNGIDISDATGIQVQTAYEYLLTGGVAGIEVLKGSQSTLYGSNAIAGVVDITTLGQVENGISHTVEVEGGSFGTVRGRYGFAGAMDGSRVTANISGLRTDGISAFANGDERDSYENVTFDLAAEHRINEAFSVFGSLLYIDAKGEFDDFGADNTYNHTLTEIMAGRVGFNLDLLDGRWKNTFSAQAFRMDRGSVAVPLASPLIGPRPENGYNTSVPAHGPHPPRVGADPQRPGPPHPPPPPPSVRPRPPPPTPPRRRGFFLWKKGAPPPPALGGRPPKPTNPPLNSPPTENVLQFPPSVTRSVPSRQPPHPSV